MQLTVDGCQRLANAIVIQAAKDYRTELKSLKKHPEKEEINGNIKSLERFFRSEWYKALTEVDGEYLMRRIRAEIENE